MSEIAPKLARVRAYLKAHKLDAVVLSTRANFAWITGGGDNHIVSQSERGFGAIVVTARGAMVLANDIEIDRLVSEEHLGDFQAKRFPWIEPIAEAAKKLLAGKAYASDDTGFTGGKALPGDFVWECRAQLEEPEIRRYKSLGRDCATAIETVARNLHAGDSEHQAEADLARHLLARGIQPFVLLVAFDQRIKKYRHPTPGGAHLAKSAMLVVCGLKGGLIASLTRLIHFGALPPELAERHHKVCEVELALWNATQVGATWGSAFKAGQAAYAKAGFKDEWQLHHQGGPTGYAGRDLLAVPDEKRRILDHQAVAWNPSITGTKTEDTYVIAGKERILVTEASPSWPMLDIGGVKRPAILVR